jgi:hypothetical protein
MTELLKPYKVKVHIETIEIRTVLAKSQEEAETLTTGELEGWDDWDDWVEESEEED